LCDQREELGGLSFCRRLVRSGREADGEGDWEDEADNEVDWADEVGDEVDWVDWVDEAGNEVDWADWADEAGEVNWASMEQEAEVEANHEGSHEMTIEILEIPHEPKWYILSAHDVQMPFPRDKSSSTG